MTYQIYIASLSDYNAGILHGEWVALEGLSTSDLQSRIQEILAASPYAAMYGEKAEEWAIHDYELGGIRISEYEDLETVVGIAQALKEHGQAFTIYYNDVGNLDEAKASFEDAYQGEYSSFLEYATQIFDELYAHDIPENIRYCIDYGAFANGLEAEGYYIESGHVFRPV